MRTIPQYHSHEQFNGRVYQLRTVHTDGGGFTNPKTYYEIWDQFGQTKLFNQWFRSVGAANTKAHKLISEARL